MIDPGLRARSFIQVPVKNCSHWYKVLDDMHLEIQKDYDVLYASLDHLIIYFNHPEHLTWFTIQSK